MASLELKMDKLSTDNYDIWKTVMTSQLMGKNLWDYVQATKHETDDDVIKNEQAKSMIYCSMEPAQIAATGVCVTAYDLWKKVKENHQGSTKNQKSLALAEFLGLKYIKNEPIVIFTGRYEVALGKLQSTGHTVDKTSKRWVLSN